MRDWENKNSLIWEHFLGTRDLTSSGTSGMGQIFAARLVLGSLQKNNE